MKAISTLVIGVVLASPAAARAQEESDVVVHGTGYKLSDSTLLESTVGLETAYVSNVFYESSDDSPRSAGMLRVLGALSIASMPADRLNEAGDSGDSAKTASSPAAEFSLGGRVAYEQYLSSVGEVQDQSNLSGGLDGKVLIAPKGNVRFGVQDNFTRHTRPVNFESSSNLDRDINRLKASLEWHPRGRTMSGILRYQNYIDRFESDRSAFADRIQHSIGLRVQWQYLPVTQFYFDASQGFYGQLGSSTLNGEKIKQSSMPLRIVVGARSAITEITTLRLHAGFAAGFYDVGPSYMSAVYGAEVGYRYSPLGRLVVAFDRSYSDSINANYYGEYRIRAGVDHQISQVFLGAHGRVGFREYDGVPMQFGGSSSSRSDLILGATAEIRYYYREWLAATAAYDASIDQTDFRTTLNGMTDDPSYVRHEISASILAAF